LFTSTNNEARTLYQDDNLKYTLYKPNFVNTANGSATYVAADYDSLQLATGGVNFARGEPASVVTSANAAGTVTITSGLSTVTAGGTSFVALFAVGDYIAIRTTTGFEVAKIKTITSNTVLVVVSAFTVSASGRQYFRTVAGTVDYVNKDYPATIHLRDTSTKL